MTIHLTIQAVLPWVMSIATIATMYLAGEKKRVAWVLGLFNQVMWFSFIATTKQLGLIPMSAAITVVYARNLWKWYQRPTWWKKVRHEFFGKTGEIEITIQKDIKGIWEKKWIDPNEWPNRKPVYPAGFTLEKKKECRECGAVLRANEPGEFCYPCASAIS